MLKIFNYEKPGKGIRENEPQKKGVFLYFEILRLRLKYMLMLNLLFIITSIPVVTIGPSFAAMTHVLKTYIDGGHSWGAFKKHFRQGFFAGIVTLLFGYGFIHNLLYFAVSDGLLAVYMTWLFAALLILFVMVHSYVYTLMVTVRETTLELFTDAFIMALANLPKNLVVTAGMLIYPFVIGWLLVTGSIPPFITLTIASSLVLFSVFSFVQLAAVLYTSEIIKKYR